MALKERAMFLYGYEINKTNYAIDFKAVSGGPEIQATLNFGYYTLTGLMQEIVRALSAVDSSQRYTATANRLYSGGLENRVTISASGSFFQILWGTGSRQNISPALLLGFLKQDYTGGTSYTGQNSSGLVVQTTWPVYNYSYPELNHKVQGARTVSASGVKEAIVFQIQKFIKFEIKYETPLYRMQSQWAPFMDWIIQQKPFEFTPEFNVPNTFYECTLDSSQADNNGLGFEWKEMLPKYVDHFQSGPVTLRVRVTSTQFLV